VVPCALHVGLQTEPAEAQPGAVAAVSLAPHVRFLLKPGREGEGVRVASLRVAGSPIAPSSEPLHEPDGRLVGWSFARSTAGPAARRRGPTWQVSGEYESSGWFEAAAVLDVHRPTLRAGRCRRSASPDPPPAAS
jgi:hypothetical protein